MHQHYPMQNTSSSIFLFCYDYNADVTHDMNGSKVCYWKSEVISIFQENYSHGLIFERS